MDSKNNEKIVVKFTTTERKNRQLQEVVATAALMTKG